MDAKGYIEGRTTVSELIRQAREEERERCAKIADQFANNAERRMAGHTNVEAKNAAGDKMLAGREIAAAIRNEE